MYKSLITQVKDVDEKGIITVAANCLGNIDAQRDISHPGSFQKTLSENFSRLRWFLNHNSDFLLGVPLDGKEENPYLQMRGKLNLKKELSRDVYEDYKLYAEHGMSLEHSIGVEAVKKEQKGDVRHVYEWKMWEWSTLYGWGANERTHVQDIKSLQSVSTCIDFLELQLRKGNYTDEKFNQIEIQLRLLKSLTSEPDEMDCPKCKAKNPHGSTNCKGCNHDMSTQTEDEPMKMILPFAQALNNFNNSLKA